MTSDDDVTTGLSEARRAKRLGHSEVLLGLAGVVMVVALVQVLLFRYGRDQGIYAVIGRTIVEGGAPYRDAWDFKPPGIFFVYALSRAFLGEGQWGIRVIEVAGYVALVPLFVLYAKRFWGDWRAGWFGAAVAIITQAQLEFWHTAQPESFGGVLTFGALVLGMRVSDGDFDGGAGRRSVWAARGAILSTGALFGMAGMMKPHLVGGLGVVAIHMIGVSRRRGKLGAECLVRCLVMGLGAAFSVLLCLGWFWKKGAYGDLVETLFVFAPGYASTTWNAALFLPFLYEAIEVLVAYLAGLIFIGMLLCIGLGPMTSREREGLAILGGVILIHLVGIAIQSKFFPYHFGATLPLAGLIAGLGFYKLMTRMERYGWLGAGGFAAIVYMIAVSRTATRDLPDTFWERSHARTRAWLQGTQQDRDRVEARLYTVADVDYGENMSVARWLRGHTDAFDTVYVWGFEPFIYDVTGRKAASRYIYNVPQRVAWGTRIARERLMQDLDRSNPRAVVVEHRDVFPVVTGTSADSADELLGFEALRTWLEDRYVMQGSTKDFDLNLRKW